MVKEVKNILYEKRESINNPAPALVTKQLVEFVFGSWPVTTEATPAPGNSSTT